MQPGGVMQSLHPTANTQWWYTKPGANILENKKQLRMFAPNFFAWAAGRQLDIYDIYGMKFLVHHKQPHNLPDNLYAVRAAV